MIRKIVFGEKVGYYNPIGDFIEININLDKIETYVNSRSDFVSNFSAQENLKRYIKEYLCADKIEVVKTESKSTIWNQIYSDFLQTPQMKKRLEILEKIRTGKREALAKENMIGVPLCYK